MSIRKAKCNGKIVHADLGKELRGKTLTCRMCGANMHVHRYPNADDYHFSLNPGEKHTRACRFFDVAGRDIPELMESVADFIYHLMRRDNQRRDEAIHHQNLINHDADETKPNSRTKRLTSVKGMIKSGYYFEDPYDLAFEDQNIRFIDLVIFDRWFSLVWQNELTDIGPRVVDTRWIGSFKLHPSSIIRIEKAIEKNREIWFRSFRKNSSGKYISVMFCLDIRNCYTNIIRKLFRKGEREDGTFTTFSPNVEHDGEPMDVLIASDWHPMPRKDCQESCPLHMCDGCLGANWGCCISAKQAERFTVDPDFKPHDN